MVSVGLFLWNNIHMVSAGLSTVEEHPHGECRTVYCSDRHVTVINRFAINKHNFILIIWKMCVKDTYYYNIYVLLCN